MNARCYTVADVLERLQMSARDFRRKRAQGKLPFLEEIRPRLGRPRYRADLVDLYLDGRWQPTPARAFLTAARRRP